MASVARAEQKAELRTGPSSRRSRSKPAAQRRVASGVLSIVVVAVLLAGVVALNVAVLRVNLRIDDLSSQRAKLRADNAALASKLASAAAAARIEQAASKRLGVKPADAPTYVDLSR
jgi:cell division protein FtsL